LAGVEEVGWRSFGEELWAGVKLFGVRPITIAFALAQAPLITREQIDDEDEDDDEEEEGEVESAPPPDAR